MPGPSFGRPSLPVVHDVFGDMKRHPGTLRLLLAESLSHRARLRSMRDVLARRGGTFDLKSHALRQVVDIARRAALATGSAELSTPARLAAAAGSLMLPQEQASVLAEVFEVLSRIRLHYQLAQIQRDEQRSDVVSMRRLSPLDRSLIGQAVREIAGVQTRMSNLLQTTSPSSW